MNALYIVSQTSASDPKKKYFAAVKRGGKSSQPRVITSFIKHTAQVFSCVHLAQSYLRFLNDRTIFPNGETFSLSEEHAGYANDRVRLSILAEA